jgi:Zn-dependent protease
VLPSRVPSEVHLEAQDFALKLTTYVVLLFSLSFHESAHGWMAFRMGDDTAVRQGRVTLNPLAHIDPIGTVLFPLIQLFGGVPLLGWAKPTPVGAQNFRQLARGHVLVAGAGPASNLLLALICTLIMFVSVKTGFATHDYDLSFLIPAIGIQMNLALAIFNLIPIPPLDGSWLASWGLPRHLGDRYDSVMEPVGGFILLLLFIPLGRLVVGPLAQLGSQLLFQLVA